MHDMAITGNHSHITRVFFRALDTSKNVCIVVRNTTHLFLATGNALSAVKTLCGDSV